MFAARWFCNRFFPGRYFPHGGLSGAVPSRTGSAPANALKASAAVTAPASVAKAATGPTHAARARV